MNIVAGIIGFFIICTFLVLWLIEIAQDDPTETEATDGVFTSRDDWLRGVADLDFTPERKAMNDIREAVLVGGPKCGESVTIVPGQWHYSVCVGGLYYRWDRTDRVSNGQVVFMHTKCVASVSQLPG